VPRAEGQPDVTSVALRPAKPGIFVLAGGAVAHPPDEAGGASALLAPSGARQPEPAARRGNRPGAGNRPIMARAAPVRPGSGARAMHK